MPMVKSAAVTRKGTVGPPLPKILTDSNIDTTLHGGDGGGEASFFKQSVSTNFVANCSFVKLKPLPYVKAWIIAPSPPHHLNQ